MPYTLGMNIRAAILARIEKYLIASGMGSQRFGRIAVGDEKLVRRLRSGKGVTLTTVERLEAFMRDHPPTSGNVT
jgi:hypothetical protein